MQYYKLRRHERAGRPLRRLIDGVETCVQTGLIRGNIDDAVLYAIVTDM